MILGSGELEFEEFCILAARFLIEEDEEQMKRELKEAFRFYDKEGKTEQLRIFKIFDVKSQSYKNHRKPNIFICYQKGLGYLTIDTLKGILLELEPNLGDEQLMEIVEEVDEDGSGTIDFDGKLIIIRP